MNSEFLWYVALILLIFLVIFCLWDDWRKRKKKSEDDAARAVERRVRIDESKHRLNKKVSALTQPFCSSPVSKPRRKMSEESYRSKPQQTDDGFMDGVIVGAMLGEITRSNSSHDSNYSGGGGSFGGAGASSSWDSGGGSSSSSDSSSGDSGSSSSGSSD